VSLGAIPWPKGFLIEGKRHMKELKNKFDIGFNEINHKIDMKVKKDYQVIISPLLQSMLGFRQAIFPGGGEYVSDWVGDLKKGLNSLHMYCPLVELRMVGDAQEDTAKSMSSLISSFRKYRISFSCMMYVIIVVSFRIVTMSWFHSRENSFRFLQ
jgi:hypothetical protein